MAVAGQVEQFLSGVFFGVVGEAAPAFREDPSTEDPIPTDLGNAFVEIRMFDTTFIEVLSVERSHLRRLALKYPDAEILGF